MTTKSVSVVICAYTVARWTVTQRAIESALDQDPRAEEIIVVVDHCPELVHRVRTNYPAGVRVVQNSQSPGLSGARNIGVSAASGDVVAFLDDDACAEPGWLAAHLSCYEYPDVVGVGGKVVPSWESPPPRWFPPEFGWVVGCSYVGQPTTPMPIRNPIGANMSFDRARMSAAGAFSNRLGRVGTAPAGCEETELSIRLLAMFPTARIIYEPAAVVHHRVTDARATWAYFHRRCWNEGLSKATLAALSNPRSALESERAYVTHALPRALRREAGCAVENLDPGSLHRALAIFSGLTVTTAGYLVGRSKFLVPSKHQRRNAMTTKRSRSEFDFLNFDVHGRVGIRVAAGAPAAPQLSTMLACFATDRTVTSDISVTAALDGVEDPAHVENDLRYTNASVEFLREKVQIVRNGGNFRIHGSGELLTALVPVLDRAMVERGAAMIHAATVAYRGHAIALPAAGGTGKTSTVAKLMRKHGYSFMGDDWAFLADDKNLLGYAKPMFIKPHHRDIYPHMFEGVRKPMIPVSMSRPVGRLTTLIHPTVVQYPRLADFSRRWSPEHRIVDAAHALPGVPVTESAPLSMSMYVERYGGTQTRLSHQDESWMVDRMLGNFHIEMAGFSQEVVAGLAATSLLSWRQHVNEKADVLVKALAGIPCYLLQVPAEFSPDRASDEVVRVLEEVMPALMADA